LLNDFKEKVTTKSFNDKIIEERKLKLLGSDSM